jgi:uridine phosphorylase
VATHLRPTAQIAADTLLPGDPGCALALAQALLIKPRMANHSRGLWGYTGTTRAGHELTIQSTGIGGPSGAIVLEELATLGVRRAVRVGTCVALDGRLELGKVVLVGEAVADDGASMALGAKSASRPDAVLKDRMKRVDDATPEVIVASTDLFYDPERARRRDAWLAAGASAVELGTAALFEVGRRRGVAVASFLVVSELEGGKRLSEDELSAAAMAAGRLGAEAFAA